MANGHCHQFRVTQAQSSWAKAVSVTVNRFLLSLQQRAEKQGDAEPSQTLVHEVTEM